MLILAEFVCSVKHFIALNCYQNSVCDHFHAVHPLPHQVHYHFCWMNYITQLLVTWCITNIGFNQVANKSGEWNFSIFTNIFSPEHSIMLHLNTLPFNLFCLSYCSNSSHLLACSSPSHSSTKAHRREFIQASL